MTNFIVDEESHLPQDQETLPKGIWNHQSSMRPLLIDLFASRLSHQLPRSFSCKPDPLVEATDAFLQDWSIGKGFTNTPWCLIGRVMAHVCEQQVQTVLVHCSSSMGSTILVPRECWWTFQLSCCPPPQYYFSECQMSQQSCQQCHI